MIHIKGSSGEGGGQILRTSLALALVTGRAFRIENIRANRPKPGLRRQHLAAVQAAATIGNAVVEGATLGSLELVFQPANTAPGEYEFAVGTAGSAPLILQTVLPALLTGSEKSVLTLAGGTHNPKAPPFEFLQRTFLPLLGRMGPRVSVHLLQHGFYPAGGGQILAEIEPTPALSRLDLLERGAVKSCRACAVISRLPRHVAERELKAVSQQLGWSRGLQIEEVSSPGPGNVLLIEIESENVTEVFSAFGERGIRAETVAERAATEAGRYLEADVPVGEHLADQLLLPLALAGGGSFKTLPLAPHATTNIATIQQFLPVKFVCEPQCGGCVVHCER